tara:strand:- start:39 stop:467 length:429 start_codon:yes stop_codon:yes gene_type:complete
MPDLEVTIFNQKLKLSYQENEKERLIKAVDQLNNNWKKFSHLHGKVSDLKIIILISLEIQDSIEDIKLLKDKINVSNIETKSLKKEIEIKTKELEDSIKKIKKIELELSKKNEEIIKIENNLDEISDDLLQIKNNLLQNKNE